MAWMDIALTDLFLYYKQTCMHALLNVTFAQVLLPFQTFLLVDIPSCADNKHEWKETQCAPDCLGLDMFVKICVSY